MRYFKNVDSGYILAVSTGSGGKEITAEEYAQIVDVIKARPTPSEGKDYRMTESLEWEEYDKPVEEVDEELSEEEALSIILGGEA